MPAKPLFDTVEDVLAAVNEHILTLNNAGGKFGYEFQKEFHPRSSSTPFRLSSSGKCGRRMAYEHLIPEQNELPTIRSLNIFFLGDVLHDMERALINEVTVLRSVEETVTFHIPEAGMSIRGHTDGVLELKDGPIVLDIKTASASSFTRMVKEGPGLEYTAQINSYMHALNIHRGVLWLYNKDTSERAVVWVPYDPELVNRVKKKFATAKSATLDNLPPREFEPIAEIRQRKPTGRDYLPFQCVYCPYHLDCWSGEGFTPVEDKGKTRLIREAGWFDAKALDEELAGII